MGVDRSKGRPRAEDIPALPFPRVSPTTTHGIPVRRKVTDRTANALILARMGLVPALPGPNRPSSGHPRGHSYEIRLPADPLPCPVLVDTAQAHRANHAKHGTENATLPVNCDCLI